MSPPATPNPRPVFSDVSFAALSGLVKLAGAYVVARSLFLADLLSVAPVSEPGKLTTKTKLSGFAAPRTARQPPRKRTYHVLHVAELSLAPPAHPHSPRLQNDTAHVASVDKPRALRRHRPLVPRPSRRPPTPTPRIFHHPSLRHTTMTRPRATAPTRAPCPRRLAHTIPRDGDTAFHVHPTGRERLSRFSSHGRDARMGRAFALVVGLAVAEAGGVGDALQEGRACECPQVAETTKKLLVRVVRRCASTRRCSKRRRANAVATTRRRWYRIRVLNRMGAEMDGDVAGVGAHGHAGRMPLGGTRRWAGVWPSSVITLPPTVANEGDASVLGVILRPSMSKEMGGIEKEMREQDDGVEDREEEANATTRCLDSALPAAEHRSQGRRSSSLHCTGASLWLLFAGSDAGRWHAPRRAHNKPAPFATDEASDPNMSVPGWMPNVGGRGCMGFKILVARRQD
uniref:Cytochrome P450 n=1 Tax=Mycena chlorophos TaxID=658473 RepID=A0ABQ0LVQ1_MYCCL|nr:predicted protein [Mycena chlorophos]